VAKKREERSSGGRDLQTRLKALAGLVVIVGSAAAILFAAGVLGGQGGGTTATGIKIENALVLETSQVADDVSLVPEAESAEPAGSETTPQQAPSATTAKDAENRDAKMQN